MTSIIQPLATASDHISTQLVVRTDGIISAGQELNAELYSLIVNGGLTVIVVLFLWAAIKKGFSLGTVLGGLFVAGLAFFALNGGLELVGNMIRGEFA